MLPNYYACVRSLSDFWMKIHCRDAEAQRGGASQFLRSDKLGMNFPVPRCHRFDGFGIVTSPEGR
jgi:hypothetical protein